MNQMTQTKFKARSLRRQLRFQWPLYLFALPAVIYLLIFAYGPMYGVQVAFRYYMPGRPLNECRWVGWHYFEMFIGDPAFRDVFNNTIILSVYYLVANFPFPIILALMLNEVKNKKYKRTLQTIYYAPHFISTVVLIGMLKIMLSPSIGIVNFLRVKLGFESIYYLGKPEYFRPLYVWSGVWQHTGWNAIVYLAALSAVDPSLLEAAEIDGAGRLRRIWHINLTAIRPTIIILFIMSIGSLISVGFEKTWLLQNPLNNKTSEVIATYVYSRGLMASNLSYGAAIGLFNNTINLVLLIIANTVARRFSEISLF